MKPETTLTPEFVECVPAELPEGLLYVSMPFGTASHLCPCGCKLRVVTPISPTDWLLIFDGVTVTLEPSIGNWSFPCRSHYWIRQNRIVWAEAWGQQKIDANRRRDRETRQKYFSRDGEQANAADAGSGWLKRWIGGIGPRRGR